MNANESGFSLYLSEDFDSENPKITAKAGIDVGTNENVSIAYAGSGGHEIIFNTNGGTLSVNDASATVAHYGSSESVTITAVASSSYHLYGTATEVTISQGRLYVEKSGKANLITCKVTSAAVAPNSIKIEAASTECVGDINIERPAGVETGDNVVTIPETLKNNVINDKTSESGESLATIGTTYFGGGYGTKSNPFKIASETHLLNVNVLVADQTSGYARYCFEQTADIVIDANNWWKSNAYKALEFSGTYNGGGHSITVGTELTDTKYFTLKLFNLNGDAELRDLHLVSSANCMLSAATINQSNASNLTFDNVDASGKDGLISTAESNSGFIVSGHLYSDYDLNVVIKNCNVNASVSNTGDCTGAFIGGSIYWGLRSSDLHREMDHRLTVENSTFKGAIYGKSQAGLIFGNQAGTTFYVGAGKEWTADEAFEYIQSHLTINNVTNEGTLFGGTGATVFGGSTQEIIVKLHEHYKNIVNGTYAKSTNVLDKREFNVYYDAANGFQVYGRYPETNYTYELGISMSLKTSENTAMNGRQVVLDLGKLDAVPTDLTALAAGGFYLASDMSTLGLTDGDKVADTRLEEFDVGVYVKDGKIYVIIADPGADAGYIAPVSKDITLTVYAYDEDGILSGQSKIK